MPRNRVRESFRLKSALAVLFLAGAIGIVPAGAPASASVPPGLTSYVSVTPQRLADTRPGEPTANGFTRINANTIRVQVAGRAGVASNARAAVLNIVGLNNWSPGFVTVYPAGATRPTASNLNLDAPLRVIANMVTVKLGSGAVDIFTQVPMDIAVDVSGAYVPATTAVSAGRFVPHPLGAKRVVDTRDTATPLAARSSRTVDLSVAGVPASASAVVVNLTAVEGAPGFWSAYPSGISWPGTSTLNLDGLFQIRPGQAIVQLPTASRSLQVYSHNGGHFIVDVAGWFTGATDAAGTAGMFLPSDPRRVLDTRWTRVLAPFGGSTFETLAGNATSASAAVINLTGTESWNAGFLTLYPAGQNRPLASNLNFIQAGQTIANHAIVSLATRGFALYTQNGAHMIADVAGWFIGTPSASSLPPAPNPAYNPAPAAWVTMPELGKVVPIASGDDLDLLADAGYAATWPGEVNVPQPGNRMLFGHRTVGAAPFRNIHLLTAGDLFVVTDVLGRQFTYIVTRQDTVLPSYTAIEALAAGQGVSTAQLVACTPPGSVKYRIVVTGILVAATGG
jgi:LPXTG-site transpeptidase (sortase) family protein